MTNTHVELLRKGDGTLPGVRPSPIISAPSSTPCTSSLFPCIDPCELGALMLAASDIWLRLGVRIGVVAPPGNSLCRHPPRPFILAIPPPLRICRSISYPVCDTIPVRSEGVAGREIPPIAPGGESVCWAISGWSVSRDPPRLMGFLAVDTAVEPLASVVLLVVCPLAGG